jgi:hypothetical protein
MWQYVIGGATIFGLIGGLFSVYNGRATRKYIGELIKEEGRRTQELIDKHGERTQDILERQGKILERLVEQHTTLISMLKTYRTEGG